MADDKKIKFTLELDSSDLQDGLKNATSGVAKFGDNTEKTVKKANSAFASFAGNLSANIVSGVSKASARLVGYFVEIGRASLQTAIEAESAGAKFDTVFSDILPKAEKTTKDLAAAFRLTNAQAKTLVGNTGDLLVGFGLSSDKALELSTESVKLAAALSDFNNIPIEQASKAIASAFTGEREALKSLGVVINEELVKKQLLKQSSEGMVFANEAEAKAFATLTLAVGQSGSAIDAFITNSDKASTLMNIFETEVKNAEETLGKALLPTYKEVTKEAIKFMRSLDITAIANFIKGGIVSLIGALRSVLSNISPITTAFQVVWSVGKLVFNSLTSVVDNFNFITTAAIRGLVSTLQSTLKALPSVIVPDSWLESLDTLVITADEKMKELTPKIKESTDEISANIKSIVESFSSNEDMDLALERLDSFLAKVQEKVATSENATTEIKKQGAKDKAKIDAKKEKDFSDDLKTLFNLDKKFITSSQEYRAQSDEDRINNQKATLNTIGTLTSSNNKHLFKVGQAAQIAQATIDGISAVQKALASAPPPFNFALAGLVGAATAINVNKIATAKPPAFATGGVISGGSTAGDNLLIAANAKERVLTARQNESFEKLVDLSTSGSNIGLNAELLININNTLASKDFSVNIDGSKLNSDLDDIKKRRLS